MKNNKTIYSSHHKEREQKIYKAVIAGLLSFLIVTNIIQFKNFRDLLKVNDDLIVYIEEQRVEHTTIVSQWAENYRDLQDSYAYVLSDSFSLGNYPYQYTFTEEEVYLLAQCVEAEAGVYCYESQQYITQVILNRIHSDKFPDTLEEVIYQKTGNVPQFSVAYNNAMDREVRLETLLNVYNVLIHGTDLPDYVLFFFSEKVTNNWVNTLNVYTTLEGTVFAYANT